MVNLQPTTTHPPPPKRLIIDQAPKFERIIGNVFQNKQNKALFEGFFIHFHSNLSKISITLFVTGISCLWKAGSNVKKVVKLYFFSSSTVNIHRTISKLELFASFCVNLSMTAIGVISLLVWSCLNRRLNGESDYQCGLQEFRSIDIIQDKYLRPQRAEAFDQELLKIFKIELVRKTIFDFIKKLEKDVAKTKVSASQLEKEYIRCVRDYFHSLLCFMVRYVKENQIRLIPTQIDTLRNCENEVRDLKDLLTLKKICMMLLLLYHPDKGIVKESGNNLVIGMLKRIKNDVKLIEEQGIEAFFLHREPENPLIFPLENSW